MKQKELTRSNIKRFAEIAETWDEKPERVQLARAIADAIRKQIPLNTDMTALELGCGTGLVTLEIARDVKSITAIDTSKDMLDVLHKKLAAHNISNIVPVRMDVTAEGLPGERYDLIYSAMTLHHIAETDALLKAFVTSLSPGGYLAIADLAKEAGTFHDDNTGVAHFGFAVDKMKAHCEKHQLVDIQTSTAFVIQKEREGGAEPYPVFLLTARKEQQE